MENNRSARLADAEGVPANARVAVNLSSVAKRSTRSLYGNVGCMDAISVSSVDIAVVADLDAKP